MRRKGHNTKKKLQQLKKLGAINDPTFNLNIEDTDELLEIKKQVKEDMQKDSFACLGIEKNIGLDRIIRDLSS